MKLVVDLTRCQGYGQCAYFAPGVFRMRGNEVLMDDPEPDDDQRDRVLRAAAACPVQAIRIDGIASKDAASAAPSPVLAAAVPAQRTASGIIATAVETFRRSGRIVIVGASLAGLVAATVMRRDGFTGSLTIIGDEPYQPYDRPPLSKQVFQGLVPAGHTALPGDVNARWLLGVPATGLDMGGKQVRLADGSTVEFDRLLIATGTRARPWPNEAEAALDGVFVLRTRDDAAALSQRLAGRPRRVLVIGAGFTGSEVASACRDRDIDVTVAERGPAPLAGALGEFVGNVAAGLQRGARRRPALRRHGHRPGGRRSRPAPPGTPVRRQPSSTPTWPWWRSARSATPNGCAVPAWPSASGAWPATRAAVRSTSTA